MRSDFPLPTPAADPDSLHRLVVSTFDAMALCRDFADLRWSFVVAAPGYRLSDMEWHLDDHSRILEIALLEGRAPSRDEVEVFLQEMDLLVGDEGVRAMLIDGQRVSGGHLTFPEIVGLVRYQAARWRTLGVGVRI